MKYLILAFFLVALAAFKFEHKSEIFETEKDVCETRCGLMSCIPKVEGN